MLTQPKTFGRSVGKKTGSSLWWSEKVEIISAAKREKQETGRKGGIGSNLFEGRRIARKTQNKKSGGRNVG